MARAALPGRLSWQPGRVVETIQETQRAKSLVLDLPSWSGHRAGQHVDIRLTADDGYQAQRGYSIASAPEDDGVMLTVDRLEDGEVSPYLTDVVEPGDEIEVRGPIGGYFVWDASLSGPLQLISGGSGIVPLRAMLRHWAAARPPVKVRLLHSARSLDDVIYRDELMRFAAFDEVDLHIALTRTWPERGAGTADASTAPTSRARHGPRRTSRTSTSADQPPSSRRQPLAWSRPASGPTRSRPSASDRPEVDMTYLLDGNAIAGDLFAAFGREMIDVVGKCRNCRRASAVAELCVYPRAPGAVARCPSCDAVVMVLVTIGGECHVYLPALEFQELA